MMQDPLFVVLLIAFLICLVIVYRLIIQGAEMARECDKKILATPPDLQQEIEKAVAAARKEWEGNHQKNVAHVTETESQEREQQESLEAVGFEKSLTPSQREAAIEMANRAYANGVLDGGNTCYWHPMKRDIRGIGVTLFILLIIFLIKYVF